MVKIDGEQVAKDIIEEYGEIFGSDDCCCMLAQCGYEKDELKAIGFDKEDIKIAIKNGYLEK